MRLIWLVILTLSIFITGCDYHKDIPTQILNKKSKHDVSLPENLKWGMTKEQITENIGPIQFQKLYDDVHFYSAMHIGDDFSGMDLYDILLDANNKLIGINIGQFFTSRNYEEIASRYEFLKEQLTNLYGYPEQIKEHFKKSSEPYQCLKDAECAEMQSIFSSSNSYVIIKMHGLEASQAMIQIFYYPLQSEFSTPL